MTVKELIEKLQKLPENAKVEMCYREYGDADDTCGYTRDSDVENIYLSNNEKEVMITTNDELMFNGNFTEIE